jgi:hypothetical protein
MAETEPNVFIIESLDFEDERDNDFEGHVLSEILHLSRIENRYYYIRTEQELVKLLDEFYDLNFRYLHISCHGNKKSIGTTLDNIKFDRLAELLETKLLKKRLFLSACSAVNDDLANAIMKRTACYSIIGACKPVNLDDAAIFWASFYQLMFKKDRTSMNRGNIESILGKLVSLHGMPLRYYSSSRSNESGWKEVIV